MIMIQIIGGTLLAFILWGLLRVTYFGFFWIIVFTAFIAFIFPGLVLLLGSLVFVAISLLATLGFLVLLSAFRH